MLRHHRLAAAMTAVALALAPVSGAWAQAKRAAPPAAALTVAATPESVGFDSQRLAKLDAYMAKVVADGRVAGMTTFLARHGKVVSYKTYGKKSLATGEPMTKDTIFRIYSMTKPITGVAMMILFEEGKWRLDDPVTKYVPEFKNLKVVSKVDGNGKMTLEDMRRPPTMREVMSHTAGFGYGLQDDHPVDKLYREKGVLGAAGLQEMINRTAEIPLMYQPGAGWYYSSAVDIQGYIVEKLSGQSLGQFMQQRIFAPLKMHDTAFFVPPAKASRLAAVYMGNRETGRIEEAKRIFDNDMPTYLTPPAMESGGGGLVGTTMDYARFAQMIANKGQLDGVRILSPASVEMMGTNMIPKDVLVSSNGTTASRFNEAVGFGLDFMVVNDPRVAGSLEGKGSMSWGGAAGTWFWVDPTNDLIFVGMIQRLGGTGGDDLGSAARTLTYQALIHPEK
ncbi:serine hydrolase [Phenylobacterium sp. J367]|uniref:serine hydrolase domain-containing protein n=1 Tax=Phenylobacterium sp. J367 TaxID=2898435 RepID=UPI002150BC2D|nr:serine hydrolase domain-containing protein [Phenylobacterium sp. J367]MCR5880601.1 beta-lactamase family protein [Phenylobacterium sp. J367]